MHSTNFYCKDRNKCIKLQSENNSNSNTHQRKDIKYKTGNVSMKTK